MSAAAAQLGDLAAGDRQLGAVGEDQQRGAVELRADLVRPPEVDQEAAVHAVEAVRLPAALDLAQRPAHEEAAVAA